MGGHPNIDLSKARLEPFFEFLKELAIFLSIGDIHKDTCQLVPMRLSFMLPIAADDLSFRRNSAELAFDFQHCFDNEGVGNRRPIVKLPRQEDFVSPECIVHMLPDLRQQT